MEWFLVDPSLSGGGSGWSGSFCVDLLLWLPIILDSFVKKTTVWEEIRHTRNIMPKVNSKGLFIKKA